MCLVLWRSVELISGILRKHVWHVWKAGKDALLETIETWTPHHKAIERVCANIVPSLKSGIVRAAVLSSLTAELGCGVDRAEVPGPVDSLVLLIFVFVLVVLIEERGIVLVNRLILAFQTSCTTRKQRGNTETDGNKSAWRVDAHTTKGNKGGGNASRSSTARASPPTAPRFRMAQLRSHLSV